MEVLLMDEFTLEIAVFKNRPAEAEIYISLSTLKLRLYYDLLDRLHSNVRDNAWYTAWEDIYYG
jgi:hypothetical protein